MLHLPDDEDIDFELSTKFCEWLTTEELVMQYFNQKKKIEHYKTGYGVGSLLVLITKNISNPCGLKASVY